MDRAHCSSPRMLRQIPSDIMEPVLAETLAQLKHQVFNFETLADVQTKDDHGVIICDILEIANLIVGSLFLTRDWPEHLSRLYS